MLSRQVLAPRAQPPWLVAFVASIATLTALRVFAAFTT